MDGKTQAAAAAASSMSVRTAREWDTGPVPSATKQPRDWRTRPDPFAAVWGTDVEPLLRSDAKGILEAKLVLELLRTRYPEQFHAGQARTLQRRFRDWRALHGVEPEVFFEQVALPGREAAIDFTHATDLGVTIAGEPFPHLLFEFVLSYSHWTWVMIAYGETFEALAAGVQGALWALGGVPVVLRSDNLSAATHELKTSSGRDLTTRFRSVLEHYRMRSSRITPGRAHENGVAEQAHRRLKSLLAQALLVRGHAGFADVAAYEAFVHDVVAYWRNGPALVRRLHELAEGDFLEEATNVLAFGLPGVGKSHAMCAVGHALIERGHAVLFMPTYSLVQELLAAKQKLDLPRALRKLDQFAVLILDDVGYIQQSPEEAEILFTLLAERYERRSVFITSNLIFEHWDRIFRDQMATAAAIDRLVHYSVLLEFDVPSFRTEAAKSRGNTPTRRAPAGR